MNKLRAIIAILIILTVSFASCGKAGGETEDAGDFLSVIYEGYSPMKGALLKSDGSEIESRVYCFVIENTSDQEIRTAQATVIGLDENGEQIYSADRIATSLPYLRPGEKAIVTVLEADWKEFPSSYEIELGDISWGEGKGQPLTITSVKYDERGIVCDVTLKNEGDEEFVWYYDESDPNNANGRFPTLIAVVKDGDGNVKAIDACSPLDGDDILRENMTFAPGEEREVTFCYSDSYNEPEILICWR